MRRPRLDAAAAMAATRLGSAPFDNEWAMGSPSVDASRTPFNSGIALRRASMCPLSASPFAMFRLQDPPLGAGCRDFAGPKQIIGLVRGQLYSKLRSFSGGEQAGATGVITQAPPVPG